MNFTPHEQRVCRSARILNVHLALSLSWCLCSTLQAEKKRDDPRLPGAELLVRSFSKNTFELVLSGKLRSDLQSLPLEEYRFSKAIPSISADGSIVASAHRIYGEYLRYPMLIATTYSSSDRKWTDHPELEGDWISTAISPDGSQLACITRNLHTPGAEPGSSPPVLKILNLQSGKLKVIRTSQRPASHLSWSPDNRHLAVDMSAPGARYTGTLAIYVVDVQTNHISQIALGESPSWSPSGELIAYASYAELKDAQSEPGNSWFYDGHYYSLSRHQFSVISTVGTHPRVLMKFNSDVEDHAVPIWSPDSHTLLLTRVRDPDKGTYDIYELSLATSKLIKRFRAASSRVYGWIDSLDL